MCESVIADRMSGSLNGPGDIGPLLHVTSDEKERRLGLMFGQTSSSLQRVRIVGTIVVCESDLSGVAAMRERTAIQLRSGSHGGVSQIADCGCADDGCDCSEHC